MSGTAHKAKARSAPLHASMHGPRGRQPGAANCGPPDHPAVALQRAAGNTALLGAKLALFDLHEQDGSYPNLRRKIRHFSLHEDERFQETYVEEMRFPES